LVKALENREVIIFSASVSGDAAARRSRRGYMGTVRAIILKNDDGRPRKRSERADIFPPLWGPFKIFHCAVVAEGQPALKPFQPREWSRIRDSNSVKS
jgi:hypothetical protein